MLRGIPAIETFQFMKCANQATGEEEEGARLEGSGIARPGPDHLIWEEREEGISGIERTEAVKGSKKGKGHRSRYTETERSSVIMAERKGCKTQRAHGKDAESIAASASPYGPSLQSSTCLPSRGCFVERVTA